MEATGLELLRAIVRGDAPQPSISATAQLTVHLTRPITTATGPVVAEGRIVHAGRRVATAEGTLRAHDGALLAHGTTTCVILPRGRD